MGVEDKMDAILKDGESLDDAIKRAGAHATARLLADPEWTAPKYYHLSVIIEAVAAGIISGDPWYWGYQLPKDYSDVINRIAKRLQDTPPTEILGHTVIQISLIDMEIWLREKLMADYRFTAWNEGPGSVFVSKYDDVPTERQFADLDAIIRNIIIFLRDHTRDNEEFNRKFEKNRGK